ncbi:hypothetical protein CFC21_107161 [Triticum aestivum]|uniref:non-specific serine/threonine protein kinase n=2 Tax=Triticum aestivum TaxID=4565 RepID=A0A9R1MG40_WHEAT|nr:hypothetical protein CFC21_107161 [Triticum aestivum]
MFIVLLLILGFEPFAAAGDPLEQICNTSIPYNSTYQANLELLSTVLSRNASSTGTNQPKGFVRTDQDPIYGVAQCPGDTIASACSSCITTAFHDAWRLCGSQMDMHFLYGDCIVHVSTEDLVYNSSFITNFTDASIDGNIKVLLQETAKQAAYNSTMMYATGRLDLSEGLPLLYSMAQCNLDLRPNDCWDCLDNIRSAARGSFHEQHGEWIAGVWCNFRYSTYQFYNDQPTKKTGWSDVTILYVEIFFITCRKCPFFNTKLLQNSQEDEELVWGIGRSSELKLFNFSQLSDATSNFSDENKLGQGGFGPVYKGQLPEGLEIAIKRLASQSGQGFTEFKNEVQLIAKLQHTNLVRLLGCCSQGEEKILIYEYLANKSLDFFIFDETKKALLEWNKRKAIIEGIAQGLLYLHKHSRLRVIHRDLKASNILLDIEMNPKISDFGLAKIFSSNDTEGNTKRIAGTYGYMAPEYASEGLFSIKSDVFSFGVLILEIINGKRNSCFHQNGDFFNLLGYAWKLWKEERWLEFVDESIVSESDMLETMRCINIALLCVQENAVDRPSTTSVVAMLSSETMALPEPKHPAYFGYGGRAT